jgi:hypothetical protein
MRHILGWTNRNAEVILARITLAVIHIYIYINDDDEWVSELVSFRRRNVQMLHRGPHNNGGSFSWKLKLKWKIKIQPK